MARRPYVPEVDRVTWWIRDPHYNRPFYLDYMAREATCIFIALYMILFVWGLGALAAGPEAYAGFIGAMQSPLGVIAQLVMLAFALYHSITWFKLAPQGMKPLRKPGGKRVPPSWVVGAMYGAFVGASAFVLILTAVLL